MSWTKGHEAKGPNNARLSKNIDKEMELYVKENGTNPHPVFSWGRCPGVSLQLCNRQILIF